MSTLALLGGILVYATRKPLYRWYEGLPTLNALMIFDRVVINLTLFCRRITGMLENGSLQSYLVRALLLALVLVAILGPGLINMMIAISLVLQPHFVRLTRSAVLGELGKDYVTSARVAGAGHMRLMFKTILPNCLAPLIVQATLSFSSAILDAAALGFLGLGAQPPTPEWGTMLAEARQFILRAWWVVTFPGLAILVTVLAINLVGDGLRDALDPKLKRS